MNCLAAAGVPLEFCPWCGYRLPASLSDEWFERIFALRLNPESPEMPEELKSDPWWKSGSGGEVAD
jgi:hypothetical protein